jgi:acetate kinase
VPHIACYDTAFHSTINELTYTLPIPKWLGFRKYGFHGLNYAHIANELDGYHNYFFKNVIVVHLGSGASLCMMKHLKSIDTSMGYTPVSGVCMGTRSGDFDPGVVVELANRYDTSVLSDLLYKQSGLLALSDGESNDMQTLLASKTDAAKFAINYFCKSIQGAIGSLAGKWDGVDTIVFTGGIGEHEEGIRNKIMTSLSFLNANVIVIPANEEATIKRFCDEYYNN